MVDTASHNFIKEKRPEAWPKIEKGQASKDRGEHLEEIRDMGVFEEVKDVIPSKLPKELPQMVGAKHATTPKGYNIRSNNLRPHTNVANYQTGVYPLSKLSRMGLSMRTCEAYPSTTKRMDRCRQSKTMLETLCSKRKPREQQALMTWAIGAGGKIIRNEYFVSGRDDQGQAKFGTRNYTLAIEDHVGVPYEVTGRVAAGRECRRHFIERIVGVSYT
ncbi:hypothetical protein FNV43_RR09552 [Rhamnella rubrinervis]|uniref:Uncharacterized protein n=1 Tax=Rhamnella rubrinervis TaxID=2594499 RepID=A0A8K0MKB6_9ROSA|nr:hypothetical protein FNV43_RR09552 [Rhamnella rubrinervis]